MQHQTKKSIEHRAIDIVESNFFEDLRDGVCQTKAEIKVAIRQVIQELRAEETARLAKLKYEPKGFIIPKVSNAPLRVQHKGFIIPKVSDAPLRGDRKYVIPKIPK